MRDSLTRTIRVRGLLWVVARETGAPPAGAPASGLHFATGRGARRFLPLAGAELPTATRWATLPTRELVALFDRAGG